MRRVVKCWWWLNGCGMDEIHPMFIKDHQGWQLITKAKTKSTSPFCNDDKHNNRFSAKANIATTNRWMMADLRHWRIPFSSSGTALWTIVITHSWERGHDLSKQATKTHLHFLYIYAYYYPNGRNQVHSDSLSPYISDRQASSLCVRLVRAELRHPYGLSRTLKFGQWNISNHKGKENNQKSESSLREGQGERESGTRKVSSFEAPHQHRKYL